ncbi:MAG: hypothetical protein HQL55_20055, partial [Magnetococcales bacterium]|nr:hypothetical protein [Magnetococcales bacterium]
MKEGNSNHPARSADRPSHASPRHKLAKIPLEETLEDWQFNSNSNPPQKSSKESKDVPSMDEIISSLEEFLDEQVEEEDAVPPVLKDQPNWDDEPGKPGDPTADATLNLATSDKVDEEAMDLD